MFHEGGSREERLESGTRIYLFHEAGWSKCKRLKTQILDIKKLEGHSEEGHSEEGHSEEGHSEEGHSEEGHSEEGPPPPRPNGPFKITRSGCLFASAPNS